MPIPRRHRHLLEGSALFFCLNNVGHRDMYMTLSRQCFALLQPNTWDLTNITSFSTYFDHNIPCSGHLVMDTPALAALCILTLTNYVTILDVY